MSLSHAISLNSSSNPIKAGLRILSELSKTSSSPVAQAIFASSLLVVEAFVISNEVDADFQRLSQHVVQVAMACSNIPTTSYSEGVSYQGTLLAKALDQLAESVVSETKGRRSRMSKLWRGRKDKGMIRQAEHGLEMALQKFSATLQLANFNLSAHLLREDHQTRNALQDAIAFSSKDELDLIRANLMSKISKEIVLPPPPPLLYGRDDAIEHLLRIYSAPASSYAAILGLGGIGKTSLALALLHQPRITEIYQYFRYFISCESVDDAEGLVAAIASVFHASEKQLYTDLARLASSISSRILIVLDNFETPWEPFLNREKVEEVLSRLVDIPNISLLLTLRGAERPAGVLWTRPPLPPLTALDISEAKQTFVEISDISETDEFLEELLAVLDGIPLAITLMATQVQYMSCASLLGLWHAGKTSAVTRGFDGRLSSLDTSIQVTLHSHRLAACPHAKPLLNILSLLPDGVELSDLTLMMPDTFDVLGAVSVLLQVSLAHYDASNRLRSLAPIREHVKLYLPMDGSHLPYLFDFHASLAQYAKLSHHTFDRMSMIRRLTRQIGNLHSVIRYSIQKASLSALAIQATVNLSYFHDVAFQGSMQFLICEALVKARELGLHQVEGECLLAQTIVMQPSDKQANFEAALSIFRGLNDNDGTVRTLASYALHLRLQANPNESIHVLEEAISLFTPNIPPYTKAHIFSLLAGSLWAKGRFSDANEAAMKATSLLDSSESPYAAVSAYVIAMLCYNSRSLFDHAFNSGREALKILGSNDDVTVGKIHLQLGNTFLAQSRLQECMECMGRAMPIFRQNERPREIALAHLSMGYIYMCRQQFYEASIYLQLSFQANTSAQSKADCAVDMCLFGQLEFLQGHYEGAWTYYCEARKLLRELGSTGTYVDLYALLAMGDIQSQMHEGCECLLFWVTAAAVSRKYSFRLGIAMAVQRIGDFFGTHQEPEVDTAYACYKTVWNWIKYLGVRRHAGDCLLRLGLCAWRDNRRVQALAYLTTAQTTYLSGEDVIGSQYCSDRIADLIKHDKGFSSLPRIPPATLILP